jgi:hypothetical protein
MHLSVRLVTEELTHGLLVGRLMIYYIADLLMELLTVFVAIVMAMVQTEIVQLVMLYLWVQIP